MSELKYKIGDKFISNVLGSKIEIIDDDYDYYQCSTELGHIIELDDELLNNGYTKIKEIKQIGGMNIEENKHHLLWEGMQSIDVMKLILSKDEYIGFLKGQIIKYQLRLGKKDDPTKEIRKIKDYTDELNKVL